MRKRNSARLVALVALLLTVPLAGVGLSAGPAPAATAVLTVAVRSRAATGIDTADRAAVRSALVKQLRPAVLTPIGWNGTTFPCVADAPSAAGQKATLRAVNYFRAMAQLDPVTFDPAMSARAQQAALMMDANQSLSHDPPPSWPCWSAEGAAAAGQSNLCLGCSGAAAVVRYLRDDGVGNEAVAHRRWVLYPPTTVMGSGSTTTANALSVVGATAPESSNRPRWVSWPTPGYFPTEFEPAGRWSLSASDPQTDFSQAKVTVRTGSGTPLSAQIYPVVDGYGANTLVWQVRGLPVPTGGGARRFDVAVIGIRTGDVLVSHRYSVRLFNADARLSSIVRPKLSGTAKVGKVLRVSTGTWSPAATSYDYTWYRSGRKITGATASRYTLTRADVGTRVQVRVRGHRGGYANGLYRTPTRRISS
jgi:hypothetical protein